MQYRIPRYITLVLIVVCLLNQSVLSQSRRRVGRTPSPSLTLIPLTAEQKAEIAGVIQRANLADYNFKFNRYEILSMQALGVGSEARQLAASLPHGDVQDMLNAMGVAYHDAGILFSAYHNDPFHSQQQVMQVIERYRMQNLPSYAMVLRVFGIASMVKDKLVAALAKSPTAQARTSSSSQTSADSEWIFPKPGAQGRYSDLTKTTMYDLGDNIFAGHIELSPGVPAVAVIFPLAVSVPKEEISDADLALIFASKVVKLSPVLSEARLGQKKENEYRFRTASGKVLIVALEATRRIAILRFE